MVQPTKVENSNKAYTISHGQVVLHYSSDGAKLVLEHDKKPSVVSDHTRAIMAVRCLTKLKGSTCMRTGDLDMQIVKMVKDFLVLIHAPASSSSRGCGGPDGDADNADAD
jgi:hypothetical protein